MFLLFPGAHFCDFCNKTFSKVDNFLYYKSNQTEKKCRKQIDSLNVFRNIFLEAGEDEIMFIISVFFNTKRREAKKL